MKWMLIGWCLLGIACGAEPLKFLCWNIHHGRGADGEIDLERIARVIGEQKPDLVALQEVDRSTGRSGGVDQAAVLAEKLGMTAVFGKAMDFSGGGYGLAVLSRLPVASHDVHRLPGPGEPRVALEVVLKRDGEDVSFVSVHLDHRESSTRVRQVEALLGALEGRARVVLCGDLNDVPASPALERFGADWTLMAKKGRPGTHPAGDPEVEIDHVLLRGLGPAGPLRVLAEEAASDHRPVVGAAKSE